MPWFWGFGWLGLLFSLLFWLALIGFAVWLLQRELPNFRPRNRPPALDLLEERYARGEISREEFLERRAVLLNQPVSGAWGAPAGPAAPAPPPEAPPPEAPPPDVPPPGAAPSPGTGAGPPSPGGSEPTQQLPRDER